MNLFLNALINMAELLMRYFKRASVFFGLAIFVIGAASCGSGASPVAGGASPPVGGEGPPPTCRAAPAAPVPSAPSGGRCVADASTEYLTADFYVDAANGNDSNSGSTPGSAWKTLSKALTARQGSVIHVAGGSYGMLQERVPQGRTEYLTLRAAPGSLPVISGITINYPAMSAAYIRLVGFVITNYDYDPNNSSIVNVTRATDIELLNNTVSSDPTRGSGYAIAKLGDPGNPYTINGMSFTDTVRIIVKSNCISGVNRGVQLTGSSIFTLKRNYISPQASSAVNYLPYNGNVLMEDNHIVGMSYTPYCNFIIPPNILANCDPATTPLDPNAIVDPHGSLIAIRSNDVVIRNNIMHGMGSSSGILTYNPDLLGTSINYSNITVEGNLIYDVHNSSILRLKNAGNNVVIRNNLLVGRYRLDPAGCGGVINSPAYRYDSAFTVESLATGADGSGITLANNIFVGASYFMGASVSESNNIFWSFAPEAFRFSISSPSGTSKIVTRTDSAVACSSTPTYFEAGFFAAEPNFQPMHGQLLNLKPSAASDATKFGNSTLQLTRKLGDLDSNGFFINDAGDRCEGQNSAGPYEP